MLRFCVVISQSVWLTYGQTNEISHRPGHSKHQMKKQSWILILQAFFTFFFNQFSTNNVKFCLHFNLNWIVTWVSHIEKFAPGANRRRVNREIAVRDQHPLLNECKSWKINDKPVWKVAFHRPANQPIACMQNSHFNANQICTVHVVVSRANYLKRKLTMFTN